MRNLRIPAVSLFFTGIVVACSGSSFSSDGIAFEELPSQYAAAVCTAYQTCFGPIFSLFINGSDCTEVTTNRFENGTFALIGKKIDEGTVHYDGTKARACLDAISKLSCNGLLERDQPECLAALDGVVGLGDDCDLDEECKGHALCQSENGTCPGKCAALLSKGQACEADGDCDSGLLCSKEAKLCVEPAVDGEPCENGAPPCGPGLICLGKDDNVAPKTSGVCRSISEALSGVAGEACDLVAGTLCTTGNSCVAESYDTADSKILWQCVKTGSYKAGESCKPGFPEACSNGNYCKTGTGLSALTGSCTAVPDAQQPCGTGFGAQCKSDAVCVEGLCQNYAENGVSCTGDDMCYSEYCGATGGCEPRLPCE